MVVFMAFIFLWLFQAMVTRFSSISTRKLSNALKILTFDKCMVATSDYNDFHKTIKRHILSNVLGANAQVSYFPISLSVHVFVYKIPDSSFYLLFNIQKRHCLHREAMRENMSRLFNEHAKTSPDQAINFRSIFEPELFGLAVKQVSFAPLKLDFSESRVTITRLSAFVGYGNYCGINLCGGTWGDIVKEADI